MRRVIISLATAAAMVSAAGCVGPNAERYTDEPIDTFTDDEGEREPQDPRGPTFTEPFDTTNPNTRDMRGAGEPGDRVGSEQGLPQPGAPIGSDDDLDGFVNPYENTPMNLPPTEDGEIGEDTGVPSATGTDVMNSAPGSEDEPVRLPGGGVIDNEAGLDDSPMSMTEPGPVDITTGEQPTSNTDIGAVEDETQDADVGEPNPGDTGAALEEEDGTQEMPTEDAPTGDPNTGNIENNDEMDLGDQPQSTDDLLPPEERSGDVAPTPGVPMP